MAELDATAVKVTFTTAPKPLPASNDLVFGKHTTDHMLVIEHYPETGWGTPEIKPYAPLTLDPASSCFQYCPSVFEGMKAYLGPDGQPRLFRPELNMARMTTSAERVALPSFSTDALLALIKRLVLIDQRWIPSIPGSALYIRPTLIGTRPQLGVVASDHALLYAILSPTAPMFTAARPLALRAVYDHARSWPGGTGAYKLGLNYAPTFHAQRAAAQEGFDQVLWLIDEGVGEAKGRPETLKITEAGAMNIFVVLARDDGDLDVLTPPLDGTILPGLTRASCITLAGAHPTRTSLAHLPNTVRLHVHERAITVADLQAWSARGTLREVFCVGTAVVVAPVGRIGLSGGLEEITLPHNGEGSGGFGPVGRALRERIVDIQEGKIEWEGWSVLCQ